MRKGKSQLYGVDAYPVCGVAICDQCAPRLHWVILGGESGTNARTTYLEHLLTACSSASLSLLNQCQKVNIAPFIKQLGAKPILNNQPYKISDKKGGILSEFPEDLQIREFPLVN